MDSKAFRLLRVLKRDHFGQVELGTLLDPDGHETAAVRRNVTISRLWLRPVAYLLLRRERRALSRLRSATGFPKLLPQAERGRLLRSYLPGEPMKDLAPLPQQFFTQARMLLRSMHRLGVTHNDTHKEANWLVSPDGSPQLLDFQLSSCFNRRTRWFRLLALEDHRHLLKHKKKRCGSPLSPSEQKLLHRRSWPARLWMRTLKPVYRRVCTWIGWRDREGRGLLDP
ncbi:MAG TPA: serine/threonine protein kinase [Planctomycetota bacterium]|nr:serine/threonine protein kinase [Planctomycetota bacterium]